MTTIKDTFQEYMGKKPLVKLQYNAPATPENILIYNDDFRLTQVMRNLLSNSLKFTSKGIIEFGYVPKDKVVEFYIKDTGKGIKKSLEPYIFDQFRQGDNSVSREHGGTGLGLSLSKSLVELMGGKIWFESKWSKGSTFFFTLPYQVPIKKQSSQCLVLK